MPGSTCPSGSLSNRIVLVEPYEEQQAKIRTHDNVTRYRVLRTPVVRHDHVEGGDRSEDVVVGSHAPANVLVQNSKANSADMLDRHFERLLYTTLSWKLLVVTEDDVENFFLFGEHELAGIRVARTIERL